MSNPAFPSIAGYDCVIFGGAGFVGSHLQSYLAESGSRILVADLVPPKRKLPNVDYTFCDVRQPINPKAVPSAPVAYNLAAIHRTPGHLAHEYYDTNVAGAANVTSWAEEVDCQRLCFTSSISVYGPSESRRIENSVPEPSSAYGRSKLLAESLHGDWQARGANRQLVLARPAVIFGRGEGGNFTRLARAMERRRFVFPGRSDTIKACGYVNDLVRSFSFGLEQPDSVFLYNFAFPQNYDLREICEAFSLVAGYAKPMSVPRTAMVPLRWGGGRSSTLLARVNKLTLSTNVDPLALKDRGFVWNWTLESALQDWLKNSSGRNFE